MNDVQGEGAKMLAIGAVIGILAMPLVLGRYDLKPDKEPGLALRFDRLTCHAELLGLSGEPLAIQPPAR
jgi:hypothetical protein